MAKEGTNFGSYSRCLQVTEAPHAYPAAQLHSSDSAETLLRLLETVSAPVVHHRHRAAAMHRRRAVPGRASPHL